MSTPTPPAGTPAAATPGTLTQPAKPSLGVVKRREASSNPLVSRQRRARPAGGLRAAAVVAARNSATPPVSQPAPIARPVQVKSEAPEPDWQEFKLTTTKREILAGYRYHVMRLQAKRAINPMNPEEFTMPIRLHRRDPKAPLQGGKEQLAAAMGANAAGTEGDTDPKTAEERARKEAEKAATAEKIAPYGGAQKQKKQAFKKKTQQVFKSNETDKKLRYEEYFPWFIEDFDNKNTWQGQLEASLSNGAFAMFVLDEGRFKMVPMEKWYKFTEKNKFKTLSIEEAEDAIKKSTRPPRWLMKMTKQEEKEMERLERERNMGAYIKLKGRTGDRLEKVLPKSETADADELDFDEDRFADDEEAPVMEGDEQDNKEIEQRIKKEQLSANVFDTRNEKDYEEEQRERKYREYLRSKQGKKVRKALMNREGNHTYETDSDSNPYASSSEEEDEEELIRKEEERKKEEESKKEEERKKAEGAKDSDKKPGTPVPGMPSKPKPSPSKQGKLTANGTINKLTPNQKRSGTADTESGNEKARKKPKKNGTPVTTATSGQDQKLIKLKVPSDKLSQVTSLTSSSVSSQQQGKKRKANGESGEDTAGEMSDSNGTKKQRVKLVSSGRALSPPAQGTGSRMGSPAPGGRSRAGSPNTPSGLSRAASPASSSTPAVPISDEEILAVIGPEGTTAGALAGKFKQRLADQKVKALFVASLKRLVENRGTKQLYKKRGL